MAELERDRDVFTACFGKAYPPAGFPRCEDMYMHTALYLKPTCRKCQEFQRPARLFKAFGPSSGS